METAVKCVRYRDFAAESFRGADKLDVQWLFDTKRRETLSGDNVSVQFLFELVEWIFNIQTNLYEHVTYTYMYYAQVSRLDTCMHPRRIFRTMDDE